MKAPKCKVVIKCDNKIMQEFGMVEIQDKNPKVVQCSIPSEPGKEFWIEYSRDIDQRHQDAELAVDIYFDGNLTDGWLAPDPQPGAKKVVGEIRGSRRENELHPFVFTKPEIIEGETPSSVNVECIGEIWVRLAYAPKSGCARLESKPGVVSNGITRVNEKDKPPGAHCATLKNPTQECTQPVYWSVAGDDDALVFQFECRSKEWLQAQGIMRRSRRPRSEPEQVEDSGILAMPKPEPQEDTVPPRKRIKMEVGQGVRIKVEDAEEVEDEGTARVKVEDTEGVKVEELEPKMQKPKSGKKRAKVRG